VTYEPKLQTDEGLRKPDIVATIGRTAMIVDAQVVGEQSNLNRAHKAKKEYYEENEGVRRAIKQNRGVTNTIFSSATLSCRGLWSPHSANELQRLGLIRKRDLAIISSRVLIGGVAAWNVFNRTTTMGAIPGRGRKKNVRKGIG
jgi:hypothetical protein